MGVHDIGLRYTNTGIYDDDDSVTCHSAELTFPPLAQPKLVLDLTTPDFRRDARLS